MQKSIITYKQPVGEEKFHNSNAHICPVMQFITCSDTLCMGSLCPQRRKNDTKIYYLLEVSDALLYMFFFSQKEKLDLIYLQHKHSSRVNFDSQSCYYCLVSQ